MKTGVTIVGKIGLCAAVLILAAALPVIAAENLESWKPVRQQTLAHKTNLIGFETATFGVTVGYAGESHYTADGGGTWPRSERVEALCRFGMDIIDQTTMVSGGNGGMVETVDGGHTWKLKNPSRYDVMSFINGSRGWLATKRTILQTSDGCATLAPVTLPEGRGQISAISLYGETAGYFIDDKGLLYNTTDGGATWTSRPINVSTPGYEVVFGSCFLRFRSADEGLAIVMARKDDAACYLSLSTKDGGKTWNAATIGEGLGPIYISRDLGLVTQYDPVSKTAVLFSKG